MKQKQTGCNEEYKRTGCTPDNLWIYHKIRHPYNDDNRILGCQDVPANGKRLNNASTVHHSNNESVRGLSVSSIIESYFVTLSANKPGDQPGIKKKNLGEHCIKRGSCLSHLLLLLLLLLFISLSCFNPAYIIPMIGMPTCDILYITILVLFKSVTIASCSWQNFHNYTVPH